MLDTTRAVESELPDSSASTAGVTATIERRRASTRVFYRAGPGIGHSRLGHLNTGAEVTVEGIENGWFRVVLDDGGRAYVHADYLEPAQ